MIHTRFRGDFPTEAHAMWAKAGEAVNIYTHQPPSRTGYRMTPWECFIVLDDCYEDAGTKEEQARFVAENRAALERLRETRR